jgi:hypothetical protein
MKNTIILSLSIFTLASCSNLTQKFSADRAKEIHKVAIVAIEIQQQKPTDNLNISALMNIKGGNPGESKEMQSMARKVSDNLISQLHNKTGWQVVSIEKMIANSDYKKRVAADMTGARRVLVVSDKMQSVYPKDILDAMAFRKMSIEDRTKLAKSLGVDAVAELIIINNIDQSMFALGHIMGTADFSYTAQANLQVYAPQSEEPVWRSQNITGAKTKSSGDLPENLSKLEKLSQLGEEASSTAIKNLVQTYPL